MLHRLFSAATSAAAMKGKSLAVEEEEIAKSKQLLYGYLPEGPNDPINEARVLILKDEAGRKDKVFLYDSQGDEQTFPNDRFSPVPKRADRDLDAIAEYMYGAIPLSYKGMTTKMHLIPITNQSHATKALLFTRLFTVRGLDEAQWGTGGSQSSSWGSNASSSSTSGALNSGYPFPRMTPIARDTQSPIRNNKPNATPSPPTEPPAPPQRPQTAAERFISGWFPSPSPILTRGPLQRKTPMKTPPPEQSRRRTRFTTMFAIGVIIPVSSEADVNALIQGEAYSTLRRAIEELVRDVHEKLETGEYKTDFSEDAYRFLTRLRDGLGALKKVPSPWKGNEEVWRELILSLSNEMDSKFLTTLMSHLLINLSDRLNTPPTSPLHPSSPSSPPASRLLILSSSATLANRLTTMLLPFYKTVYPSPRHPRKIFPKPPKLKILSSKPRPDSSHSSYSPNPFIPREFTRNVDLARRATHPVSNLHREACKSPPILSSSLTPGGGNPASVSSWFGSWIRRGGPLAASNRALAFGESFSPYSPRCSEFPTEIRRESDGDLPSPEIDVTRDSTGEVVEVKLATSFQSCRRRSSGTFPEDYDLRQRGSMTLNNVAFTEDMFRITGFHRGKYHVDYHLQSMERTEDIESDIFRVLREDILFFFTPPVHAVPLHPSRIPEPLRFLPGQRKVTCIIADVDAGEVVQLTIRMEDEEEQQEKEILGPKDDRQWRKVLDWALNGTTGIDELVKLGLS